MSRLLSKLSNFGSNSEDDSSSSNKHGTSNRRREQVRRAQRTHRERRAKYLKGLEAEVELLRGKDASNTVELKRFQIVNERLKALLIANGIAIPPEIENIADSEVMMGVEVLGAVGGEQSLRLHSPGKVINPAAGAPIDTNDPQVAIDFVLALEQACLQHYHNFVGEDGEVGHSMAMSAFALQHAPAAVRSGDAQYFPTGSSWKVPRAQLEDQLSKLHQSSVELRLKGEMTPIMCWFKLVERHQAVPISFSQLSQLRQELMPQVLCYGFGAVIDEEVFEFSVEKILSGR